MVSVVQEARARMARIAQDQRAEQEVGGIEAAISAVARDPAINDVGLFERLQRKVGLGQQPAKRRALFKRLVLLHRDQPALIEEVIAIAWAGSCGARLRDRYFCVAVCRRLAELGISSAASGGGDGDVI